jgi:hypothetical protein
MYMKTWGNTAGWTMDILLSATCHDVSFCQCLGQCFPTNVLHHIVSGSEKNSQISNYVNKNFLRRAKNSKHPSKYRGNFCPAIGNAGVIYVRYQLPHFFIYIIIGRSSSRYEKLF